MRLCYVHLFSLVFWGKNRPRSPNRNLSLSPQQNASAQRNLPKSLSSAYDLNGTAGALDWFRSNSDIVLAKSPDDWIQTILNGSKQSKGKAAGIINALMGSCCLPNKDPEKAELAKDLLQALSATTIAFTPDLVTFCLAHQAIKGDFPDVSAEIMQKMESITSRNKTPLHRSESWKEDLENKFGIPVLRDAASFAVIDKPSGMYLTNVGRKGHRDDQNLDEILLKVGMSLSTLNDSYGLVHQLDKGTPGCLVVAKHNKAHAEWIARFFLRDVEKSYTCLVDTASRTQKLPQGGTVRLPVNGRPASSLYQVVECYGRIGARVSIRTRQGRKHQVRIHCSKGLDTPIILDPRYGGERIMYHIHSDHMKECRAKGRLCLHADSIVVKELDLAVHASPPDWWDGIIGDMHTIYQA